MSTPSSAYQIIKGLFNVGWHIGHQMVTIKPFDKNLMDSQLLHFTVSNLWDLEEQL